MLISRDRNEGRIQEFVRGGGLKFISLSRGGHSTRWGLKTPEIIDFTGPGGGLSPHSPPPEYVSEDV